MPSTVAGMISRPTVTPASTTILWENPDLRLVQGKGRVCAIGKFGKRGEGVRNFRIDFPVRKVKLPDRNLTRGPRSRRSELGDVAVGTLTFFLYRLVGGID